MRSVTEHLDRVQAATVAYVQAHNERDNCIIEASRDGCTVEQLAEAARVPTKVVCLILGREPEVNL